MHVFPARNSVISGSPTSTAIAIRVVDEAQARIKAALAQLG